MAVSVKIDSVRQANGKIYIRVGKHEQEFNSRADVLAYADASGAEVREFLFRLLLNEWKRRNPTGNNPAAITNTTATLDLDATLNPIRFSS